MCSPKLHVEVNGFGLKKKKKGQADLMCKSNQRHLEPTLEYETTLPSPTNLKERIKMQSMHLYQTFSGIPPCCKECLIIVTDTALILSTCNISLFMYIPFHFLEIVNLVLF